MNVYEHLKNLRGLRVSGFHEITHPKDLRSEKKVGSSFPVMSQHGATINLP